MANGECSGVDAGQSTPKARHLATLALTRQLQTESIDFSEAERLPGRAKQLVPLVALAPLVAVIGSRTRRKDPLMSVSDT